MITTHVKNQTVEGANDTSTGAVTRAVSPSRRSNAVSTLPSWRVSTFYRLVVDMLLPSLPSFSPQQKCAIVFRGVGWWRGQTPKITASPPPPTHNFSANVGYVTANFGSPSFRTSRETSRLAVVFGRRDVSSWGRGAEGATRHLEHGDGYC